MQTLEYHAKLPFIFKMSVFTIMLQGKASLFYVKLLSNCLIFKILAVQTYSHLFGSKYHKIQSVLFPSQVLHENDASKSSRSMKTASAPTFSTI